MKMRHSCRHSKLCALTEVGVGRLACIYTGVNSQRCCHLVAGIFQKTSEQTPISVIK